MNEGGQGGVLMNEVSLETCNLLRGKYLTIYTNNNLQRYRSTHAVSRDGLLYDTSYSSNIVSLY